MKQIHDIVFVNPSHHGPDYYSPIGISMLDALARRAGYDSAILDFQREVIAGTLPWPEGFFEAAARRLEGVRARIFGFSVMNVGLPWAVRLAAIVRQQNPESTIVFGGPHATLMGHELLGSFKEIDIIARYEGERIVVPLVQALLSGADDALLNVPNLLVRRQGGQIAETRRLALSEDLDELPMIDYDADLLANVGMLSIEAGRGCPYHCSFCSSHSIWTRKPRYKSPERLVDEASAYIGSAPPRKEEIVISYEHDDFLANRPLFKRFVEYKAQKGAHFKYGITTRINHIPMEMARLLAGSGCVSVFVGLETGSETLQTSSAKHLKLSDVVPRIQNLLALGIHVSTNFIVGFPGETWDDLYKSYDMMLAICWLGGAVNISVMCPEPGSSLYETTPKDKHVLLTDTTYVEELRGGGMHVESLTDAERSHLITIESDVFDIVAVARLARSMQFLMAEFPFSVHAVMQARGGTVQALLEEALGYQEKLGSRIMISTVYDFFRPRVDAVRTPRADEFLLYEYLRAMVKRSADHPVPPAAFKSDMPGAYHAAVRSVAAKVKVANGQRKIIEIHEHAH